MEFVERHTVTQHAENLDGDVYVGRFLSQKVGNTVLRIGQEYNREEKARRVNLSSEIFMFRRWCLAGRRPPPAPPPPSGWRVSTSAVGTDHVVIHRARQSSKSRATFVLFRLVLF